MAAQLVGVALALANPEEGFSGTDNAAPAGHREGASPSQIDEDDSSRLGGGPVAAMTFNVRYPAGNDTNE
jgi:hypothetical protein